MKAPALTASTVANYVALNLISLKSDDHLLEGLVQAGIDLSRARVTT
jgi:hypothetical protein